MPRFSTTQPLWLFPMSTVSLCNRTAPQSGVRRRRQPVVRSSRQFRHFYSVAVSPLSPWGHLPSRRRALVFLLEACHELRSFSIRSSIGRILVSAVLPRAPRCDHLLALHPHATHQHPLASMTKVSVVSSYCVSATFGHHALTETDDPVDAARAFHAIHAEDRPFVIKVRNSQARPNGSGQLIAQTASSRAGGKSCYGKWAGNGDPAFSSAYRLLLESGGR